MPQKITDLTGQKFNRLTVLGQDKEKSKPGKAYWKCQCDCGTIKSVRGDMLKNGNTKSCGCYKIEDFVNRTKKDLTNQKFGRLTALYPTDKRSGNHIVWHCKCDCGNECDVAGAMMTIGHVNSCGCISSVGESNIQKVLQENNILFEKQKTFTDLISPAGGFLRYDFYLPQQNRLVEFDGEQHNQEVEYYSNTLAERQAKDIIKNKYAKSHNIPLVRIPYKERDTITLDLIFGDKYLIKGE